MLKWLTLDIVKAQLRIDALNSSEDELLKFYAESAEDTVLQVMNRSYDDLVMKYGKVPNPVIHASLMLADVSYQFRSPVSPQNMSIVPYSFDLLIKPFIKL